MSRSRRDDGKWDLWQVSQTLRPWRRAGGSIELEGLYVYRRTRLPHGFWSLLLGLGPAVELIVEINPDRPRHARIVGYLGPRRDAALSQALAEWRAGNTLEDPRFGRFRYDERVHCFDADAGWLGWPVTLSLDTEFGGRAPPVAAAHALFDDAQAWDQRARQAMLDALFELKNGNWLEDDQPELSREEFLGRVKLESLSVGCNATHQLYYDDGGLFWGHAIVVTLHTDTGEAHAEIEG